MKKPKLTITSNDRIYQSLRPFLKSISKKPYLLITLVVLAVGIWISWQPINAIILQQRALDLISRAWVEIDSSSGGIACLQGELEDGQARSTLEDANHYLLLAIQLRPKQAFLFYRQGQALCLAGKYSEAVIALEEASHLRPQNNLPNIERGFALEKACPPKGECTNGDLSLDAWKSAGITAANFIDNGESARKNEEFDQAISWYERAQEMGADLRSTIAYTSYQRAVQFSQEDQAFAALREAVQMDVGWKDEQSRFECWFQWGSMLYNRQDYQEAEAVFRRTITLYPNQGWGIRYYSEAYRLLGLAIGHKNIDEAIDYFKLAVDIDPKNPWAHIHYGKFLYDKDPSNLSQTEEEFNQALGLIGKDQAIWNNLINYWVQVKQSGLASDLCHRAEEIGLDPTILSSCIQEKN